MTWGGASRMSMFVKVAKTHDLAEGGMVAVLVGDTEILLAQVQGQYYAISNACSHAEQYRRLCPWSRTRARALYVSVRSWSGSMRGVGVVSLREEWYDVGNGPIGGTI